MHVINMLEQHPLTSPELTGKWEKRLVDIEHGQDDRRTFMRDIAEFAGTTVKKLAELDPENFRPSARSSVCARGAAPRRARSSAKTAGRTAARAGNRGGTRLRPRDLEEGRGRTLTPEVARQLLTDGKSSEVLSGFRSRAGKSFRARLVLTEEGKVEFDFPERPQTAARATADAE